MAVRQIACSLQNDGNFSQLDLQDQDLGGPLMRIETFRCSQPQGGFGVTKAGTHVEHVAGLDHLSPASNQVFRHIFSVGYGSRPKVTLEIRETFDEAGAWEVRVRDVDSDSPSFGHVLIATVRPDQVDDYRLHYEIRKPHDLAYKPPITSPITSRISELVPGLSDIGAPVEALGTLDGTVASNPLIGTLNWGTGAPAASAFFKPFAQSVQAAFTRWTENVRVYERMGDFRDKCIHPGTNLSGPNVPLASEFVVIRAYRGSLTVVGVAFDPDMAKGGLDLWSHSNPITIDPKPGVYTPFLLAYMLNIGVYQLGIDKVHSDYGGIPMRLAPGSKLETGINPIVDSTRANRTIADLAVAFYIEPDAPQVALSLKGAVVAMAQAAAAKAP